MDPLDLCATYAFDGGRTTPRMAGTKVMESTNAAVTPTAASAPNHATGASPDTLNDSSPAAVDHPVRGAVAHFTMQQKHHSGEHCGDMPVLW